ncbi:hypothetical protein EHQ53_14470 [Leptospira langatensis]|uniref:Uncharacterized protein n=1 Tax=Leptospira langatensis TaxID=2484983 RepID=A0A5F1ZQ92_9LEPT|nr:hypothetical protein [Leptospira langatensis]TGK01941.1 hypothetical protein EHO57_09120 [Leptospira langatensis]TGL39296.1 hypothetical protein EHQ53_14470 [Leptospira langatensis]
MDLERNRKANPALILLSVLFLTGLLTLFYSWHGDPSNGESFRVLAELRSLSEDGNFFSLQEPLSYLLLYAWKSVLGLNYITAYVTFGAFFLSLAIHLCAYLMEKETWKLNHYLLCYIAAINPLAYAVPLHMLGELVSLTFLLLLFLSFRMETVLDLLVLVSCTLLGLFSHFTFFLVGFTIFVIKAGTVGIREKKKQQSVFFKRRNLPKLFLFGYLSAFVLLVIILGNLDFYGHHSFSFMGRTILAYLLGFGSIVLIVFLGVFLLRSEKELNSLPASIAIFFLIATSGYFTIRPLVGLDKAKLNSLAKDIASLRGRLVINPDERIYVSPEIASYLYFTTKQKTSFNSSQEMRDKDYILLSEIWAVDRKLLQREVKTKNTPFLFLSSERILVSEQLWKRIQTDPDLKTLKTRALEAKTSIQDQKGYDGLKAFLVSLLIPSRAPEA